jgi:hypothetical protein
MAGNTYSLFFLINNSLLDYCLASSQPRSKTTEMTAFFSSILLGLVAGLEACSNTRRKQGETHYYQQFAGSQPPSSWL